MSRIIYLKNSSTFYDTFRKKEISEHAATTIIRQQNLGEGINAIAQELFKLRSGGYADLQSAVTQGIIKKPEDVKKLGKAAVYQKMIDEAMPFIPLHALKDPAQPIKIFYVSDNRECNLVHNTDPRSLSHELFNDFQVRDKIESLYKQGEYLHKPGISWQEYLEILCNSVATNSDTHLSEDPPWISWDPTIIAHRHFDIRTVQPGPTPTWDQFLSRVDYKEVLMSWVWTIFDEKDRGRQLLWLQGNGKDGKTTFSNAIRKIYGITHSAILDDNLLSNSRFAAGSLYGKRFVANQECQKTKIFSYPLIKSLTGGDAVSIEIKGEQAFTAPCYAKILICSNKKPEVDFTLPSESSRMLFLKVRPRSSYGGEGNFEEGLISEAGAFLYKCREARESTRCESDFDIMTTEAYRASMQMECGSEIFKEMNVFWRTCLEHAPGCEESLDNIRSSLREHFIGKKKITTQMHEVEQAFVRRLESTESALSGKVMQYDVTVDGVPQTFVRDYKLKYSITLIGD